MYAAMTLRMLSGQAEESKDFGVQVGLLRAASAKLADAKKRALNRRAPADLSSAFDRLVSSVHSELKAAEHDNDIIYNEPVPSTLPTATAAAMVKPTPFVNDADFQVSSELPALSLAAHCFSFFSWRVDD